MTAEPRQTVLVVDDEPSICWGFDQLLRSEGFDVLLAGSAEAALPLARQRPVSLVLLDVRLPGASGLDALPEILQATEQAPVVVMTAFGDLETAVEAVRRGASDYLTKPFHLADAVEVCRRALRRTAAGGDQSAAVAAQNASGQPPPSGSPHANRHHGRPAAAQPRLVGRSAAMQQVFHQIALVADSDLSVLIIGETGTGKELVAEAIHRHSRRKDQPYVAVAPVAFNPSLLESELFGHVRGAFTGATEDRRGLFESADGGTILLDEIGDLPLASQIKLLRVLEQRRFARVGEVQTRPCDVRILAATHRDLRRLVSDGTFREDLLYRLSGVTLQLPPLRARPEDIGPLATHFLESIGYPGAAEAIDASLLQQLQRRAWSGNIRELRNAVERAAVVARGRRLDISDFPAEPAGVEDQLSPAVAVDRWARRQLLGNQGGQDNHESSSDPPPTALYERFLAATEPALLRAVLDAVDGNRSAAADALGMHRATLRERLKRYDIR